MTDSPAVPDDHVLRFAGLFRTGNSAKGQTEVDPQTGDKDHWTVTRAPAEEDYRSHLEGHGPRLGVPMVDPQTQTVRFGGLDLDDPAADHQALARQVRDADLPLLVCRSTSGAAHAYLFLEEPVPAATVKAKLEEWVGGLGWTNPDGRPVEVFPKQTRVEPGDVGNWISLPYYGHADTHQVAVSPEGDDLPLGAFLDAAEELRTTDQALRATYGPSGGSNPFQDGPLCLERAWLHGVNEGARNDTLFDVGVYWQLKLGKDGPWVDELRRFNEEKLDPPLSDGELKTTVLRSLTKDKRYSYRCPNCDTQRCNRRRYGRLASQRAAVGKGLTGDRAPRNLRKLPVEPPLYFVDVAGTTVELEADDLMNYRLFRKQVFQQADVYLGNVDQDTWDDIMTTLTEKMEVQEAGLDEGTFGRFRALFHEFLATSERTMDVEDLVLSRMPVRDGDDVLFRLNDLYEFLTRDRGFRRYDEATVSSRIRRLQARPDRVTVDGKELRVWRVEARQVGIDPSDRVGPANF